MFSQLVFVVVWMLRARMCSLSDRTVVCLFNFGAESTYLISQLTFGAILTPRARMCSLSYRRLASSVGGFRRKKPPPAQPEGVNHTHTTALNPRDRIPLVRRAHELLLELRASGVAHLLAFEVVAVLIVRDAELRLVGLAFP
ncbi:hypothetical protein SAMN05518847_11743 [Paenibacillus sp. OV219]|nr:hypothetical protein SAMN05518847_11743 [Paenibacillus sp. OV219]